MTMIDPTLFTPQETPMVRLHRVFRVFRISDTGVVALSGVDLVIDRGEFLAVVGPSGAGKSTLLNLVGGLDRPSAGTIEVDGEDLNRMSDQEITSYRRNKVGFVWQGTSSNLVPYLSVRDNVVLEWTAGSRIVPGPGPDELLEVVGLWDRRNHLPGQLSGGEQQRAAIALALANTPDLLLADEPTAELDSASAQNVLDVFEQVNQDFEVTIVMVTHDLAAARRAKRRVRVRDGRLLSEGRPVRPIDPEGRVRLPDDVVAMLGGLELEAEVTPDEITIRRRSESGHG
jgi:ABC-type lipoprotein export system ATPase subunit